MRVLILGGDGMLGHQLFKLLKQSEETKVTLHREPHAYSGLNLFDQKSCYYGLDARNLDRVTETFADFRPDAVVNAIGIVKQRAEAKDSLVSLEINALLPHRLAVLCKAAGARLIHMSTDCVFSGKKGNYSESDNSDADDIYGRTKFLGEPSGDHCFTMRTSIIGPEVFRKTGLLEWLLAQKGDIKGFKKAIFSGFTTSELSRIIAKIITKHPGACGLYHVSSEAISKFDLLSLIKEKMGLKNEIIPESVFNCDRSLNSSRFRKEFSYEPPSWPAMIAELAKILHLGEI